MLRLLHPQLELEYTTFVFVDPLGSDDPNTSNNSATITLEECELARGRIGRVFKGLLRYETLDDPQPLSVILKLVAPLASLVYPHSGYRRLLYPAIQRKNDAPDVLLADLAHEARLYASPSALASLQGTVVPRCYGYARNSSANAACLILEDAGKALTFPYRRLPIEDRRVLYEHQVNLHRVGLSHGDIARRNFVKGPNGIRLIDFDRGSRHECPRFVDSNRSDGDTFTPHEHVKTCVELDKLYRWFGLCPMEELTLKERDAFQPWEGMPWGD